MNRLRKNRDGGFSLVELLVTVVIIAVLAAIAIPLYTSQKNKAALAAAQDDARALAMEASSALAGVTGTVTASSMAVSGGTLTITVTGATPASVTGAGRLSPGNTMSGNTAATLPNATDQTPHFCIKVSDSGGTQIALATEAGLYTGANKFCTAGVPTVS